MNDVSTPFSSSRALPGGITQVSEVGKEVFVGHLAHDLYDVIVVSHFVEYKLDLIGGLVLEVCEADLSLLLHREDSILLESLENYLLLLDPFVDDAVDLGILQVLQVNQLIPLVVMKLGPVLLRVQVLSKLAPHVIHVEVVGDFNYLFVLLAIN